VSKYDPLWEHTQAYGRDTIRLTFDEIKALLGFDIDTPSLVQLPRPVCHGEVIEYAAHAASRK
jgi:hypothetical protein